MNIGENILKMRKEKGITQEQLADVLCISAGAVSKWETAASVPDIAMLPKIANFFGVSIDRLFNFTLTESDTPENIIKRVKELTVGFDYDTALLKPDNIQPIFKCDEAISILTDACIKFPNHYDLKVNLCHYKRLDASKNIKEPENYEKALRQVLNELYAITKLNTDKEINDRCYNMISDIHLKLKEYDKAIETAKKYGINSRLIFGYNNTILTSLIAQKKTEEAEKHIHNIIYLSISQITAILMQSLEIIKEDSEKVKKTSWAIINLLKPFANNYPGPFDLHIFGSYQILAFSYFASGEYDECVKCFEELHNHAENLKIFSETREILSDFIKYADKDQFVYNMPYDYKKHLLLVFDSIESMSAESNDYKNYQELNKREDFQRFKDLLRN